MFAEILATGDEILGGALVDSNSAFIAQTLEENGITVARHLAVGDDMPTLVACFKEIAQRADIAVVTGGLGPTQDDLSSEAAAAATGVPLEIDQRALSDIEKFFAERGRTMTASNRKQAYFPQGSTCMYNPVGTAPGFSLTIGNCRFFFMPGVPYEMRRMLEDQVLPHIRAMQNNEHQHHLKTVISSFGIPESEVGERVAAINAHFPEIKLGLRAKFPEIQVKLYLNVTDEVLGRQHLDQAAQWVADRLGDHVFSYQEKTMAAETAALLKTQHVTLAVAESCTGGLVANWLTNIAGASEFFLLSAVTYANDAKTAVLGVRKQTLERVGAVHEDTASEMAAGVRRVAGATYGLSITGIAGPDGGTPDKPVGTVCIGLADADDNFAERFTVSYGKRLMNKQVFAMLALNFLRKHLLEKVADDAARS